MEIKEANTSKNKVLEIGPGRHRFDNPNEERVYLDVNDQFLGGKGKNLQADASKGSLPFGVGVFDNVEATFPDGTVLRSLTGLANTNLWPELHRVLNDEGKATIITEEDYRNQQGEILVAKPHLKVKEAAEAQGFKVNVEQLTKDQVSKIGTNQMMVHRYLFSKNSKDISPFYRITAKK
ncbi:MAG TPA: hypothetical protein VF185_03160 [Patescibacteria group bacterium]